MKKIKFLGIFALLFCVFSNQVFAAIIIRKDPGDIGSQPNNITSLAKVRTSFASSASSIPVSADLIDSELIVDFNSTIGTAFVSVVDMSGNVVYQTAVNTYSTPELIIPVDELNSGTYSLKITYGSTKLSGSFQL